MVEQRAPGGERTSHNSRGEVLEMMTRKAMGTVFLVLGGFVLASCTAGEKTTRVTQAPTGIHEITALYKQATAYPVKPFDKPKRDKRNRMMRLLAEKTDAFIAETESWDSEARLTAIKEPDRDQARDNVRSFREALTGLKAAAAESSVIGVRKSYADVMASYRRLNETTGLTH
jgi:hypothetical protein